MLRVGNKTQGWATAVVEIDVDYFADLDQVRGLLAQAASRVVKDPVVGAHVLGEPTITGIERLSADAVTLRLKVKTSPAMQWEVAREAGPRPGRRSNARTCRWRVSATSWRPTGQPSPRRPTSRRPHRGTRGTPRSTTS